MQTSLLENKLSHIWNLGEGDIPLWAVPLLHREVIFQSIKGKDIALTRRKISRLIKSSNVSSEGSEISYAETLTIYQKRALDYVESLHHDNSPLSCSTIIKIHSLLFTGYADTKNVKFRDKNFRIDNGVITSIDFADIEPCLKQLDSWLRSQQMVNLRLLRLTQVLEFAAKAHLQLIHIHPFADGNGRTARVFLNAILRKYRLPYAALPKVQNSKQVRRAIQQGVAGDIQPFCETLEKLLSSSCDLIDQYEHKLRRKGNV